MIRRRERFEAALLVSGTKLKITVDNPLVDVDVMNGQPASSALENGSFLARFWLPILLTFAAVMAGLLALAISSPGTFNG